MKISPPAKQRSFPALGSSSKLTTIILRSVGRNAAIRWSRIVPGRAAAACDNNVVATSGNNTYLPPDLLAELEPIASSEGLSVDEVAARELRERLRDRSWQATLERGREYGRVSGITEDQVSEVVRARRIELGQ
jgi:hypothetical protein